MRPLNISKDSLFQASAGLVFALTGLAKTISALGNSKVLEYVDPIFGMQFSHLMLMAGLLEIVLGLYCLFGRARIINISLIAWLSTFILAYRHALWWVDWQRPCKCLGNFTDAIHLSPQNAEAIMKVILGYLILGSYLMLCLHWRRHAKMISSPQK